MQLSSIHWGDDNAEKDPDILKYFVSNASLQRLQTLSTNIVVGRKGSGKSAIRKKLVAGFEGSRDAVVIQMNNKFSVLKGITNDHDITENFNDELFFQYIWLRHLCRQGLISFGQSSNSDNTNVSVKFALGLARENDLQEKSLLEDAVDMLGKIKIKAGKIGELGLHDDKELRNHSELEVFEYHIINIVALGYKIVWLIDDLDLGWNNSKVSNNFLLGLIHAANYLKTLSQNLHIIIFLREDVYSLLMSKTQHSDKFRDIERLRWTKDGLLSVLKARIAHNYESKGMPVPENEFLSVFPENVGSANAVDWLIERTLSRPRELIQYAKHYTKNCDKDNPDMESLLKAEVDYSNWKLEDLCTEYINQYPDLQIIFANWKVRHSRAKYHFTRKEIEELLLELIAESDIDHPWFKRISEKTDTLQLLKILYEIGFLGDFILGERGRSKVYYSFSNVHQPTFGEIEIHPCFRKAIDILEKT